ncbi:MULTISPECIES: DUF2599 domain-containing protein [unclassified Nocardia]|uniref:DUF2599 domain-containing protein n=1 Tax=unclassified Nocardia TaxID=2637762 RepID=UPI001CE48D5F|nr:MULTISPECIES: DUF2599 domain-containing protein [unclassified Nocardia]
MSHQRFRLIGGLATALTAATVLATGPADADAQYPVAWTRIGIYPQSAPSMGSGQVGKSLPDGALVTIVCEQQGQPVFNGDKKIDVWERLGTGSWLPNAFIKTGHDGWTPGIPKCSEYTAKVAPGATDPHADPKKVEEKTKLPCDSFIASATWITRGENNLKSLHVVPTACGLVKATVDKQAAFDELYHRVNANWGGDLYWSMHNQFDCHADWWQWRNKYEWNLEPSRPNVGYWKTVMAECNP